jgi:hypothetical protein
MWPRVLKCVVVCAASVRKRDKLLKVVEKYSELKSQK